MERELFDSAVERDIDRILHTLGVHAPQYISISDIKVPSSPLTEKAVQYVKSELDAPIFNHSQRVFLIGSLLHKDQFPTWKVDPEEYYLTCLFHDMGLAPKFHLTTPMSFEFQGAIIANNFITSNSGSKYVADSVFEACANHTLESHGGTVSHMGKLMQVSASLDVSGRRPQLWNAQSIGEVYERWPLLDFHNCFADLMVQEVKHKPGCLTTESGAGYPDRVRTINPLKIFNIIKD